MKSELINHKLRTTVSGLVGRSACYRRRILVMIVMLAVLASVSLNGAQLQPVLAQADTWTIKAAMPTSRCDLGAAAIDGKLYVVGGFNFSYLEALGSYDSLNTLEVYDPGSDSWTTKAEMPTSRSLLGAAAIDGKLYVVGGLNDSRGIFNALEVYEPESSNTAPVVACKDVTVSAGSGCTATITTDDINNGSYDPDAGDNISLSLSPSGPLGIGQHTVTLTATDSHGASSSCTATVTVADTTDPVLAIPHDVVVYLPPNTTDNGMAVSYTTPTATDCSDVTITTSKASGTIFPVGTTTVNVTATDAANKESSGSFTVAVRYNFSNYLPPIDNLPAVNVVKAGSAIPVKFSLSGYKGMAILAAGFPTSQALTCGGGLLSEIAETVTAGASSLSYDATTDVYIYVWKTDRAWAGTCRQLIVKLNDGTIHTVNFQFR